MQLGKYTLVNRIAVGGMGEVFYGTAAGIEGFQKEVAIKRMLPHLVEDRGFIEMMVKEAKLTVLLNHANIVGIYDLARDGNQVYIAMEYVPGITIATILDQLLAQQEQLPWPVAVHIALNTLRGLAHAHRLPGPDGQLLTILHRDITPQNILVTASGVVKITDFGIAKAVNEISTTSPGMLKGKLGYIAPEQLEGKEPDARLDLFCVGILLWEMLAARRLFKGSNEADTFRLIADCQIPSITQLRPDVPQQLEQAMLVGLSRDLSLRYGRAEQFLQALAQAVAPRTIEDLHAEAVSFFAAHPQMFASIQAHKKADPTRAALPPPSPPSPGLSPAPAGPPGALAAAVPAPRRAGLMAAGGLVGVAAVTAVAAAVIYGRPTPAPPAPAAAPAAAPPAPAAAPPPAPVGAAPGAAAAQAAQAAQAAPPAAAPRPRPAVRRGALSSVEIQERLKKAQGALLACLSAVPPGQVPGALTAQISIQPSGKVAEVTLQPVPEDAQLASCLQRQLSQMSFRAFRGEPLMVAIPLRFQVR